ncbi:hypothetical protein CO115_05265 [Candidatus Falkowbacteria bacterium CG_4_9_14_3_um_filter_36_9]|uniref:Uncharacterized protein n=1 Tax=Candidatus Falkowbacteria bacterium CG02_land_8_20_14_3_00_36_14 TaxID=1974560 RepID=A0A2M7DN78_9BACT|nr:MAG: hypothetical protein COS18_03090 [Candidatus Falkowbacteria bacterium CG02_land_8_20_14_3_00_36_14]PIX10777.1 MAG: hypothetical protein COZ73_04845 [Candidatus Falkowbacteria bacterium CG_4_8_14_3_um_filter_36_11]PJA10031.1 MAG: hypothetical protein COX67_05635 [Candidatus Falkowbacteria bacterium CG_4_10_14_0_2_um_filter_36_22]PJB17878.1 MAG: hypothetical protein CO115_05265 [Candidatus Falkowbacteria bacterium CG_4_9_14_3_um_filter_36_9]
MTLTAAQFNKLATKEDLKSLKDEFLTKEEFKESMDHISSTLVIVVKKLDDIEHAFVSNLAAHDRFEKRISRIEKYLKLNSIAS